MKTNSIKHQLYRFCTEYVDQRIASYQKAMHDAQEAANSEDKSSAGDKYETGRAMMQIERDKNAQQLEEALKLKKALGAFSPNQTFDRVTLGSLVNTTKGTFYIAISAGKITLENKLFFAIAPTSPLALAMKDLKTTNEFAFNNIKYKILSIS